MPKKATLCKLPNGDCLDPTTIRAIRKGDPQEENDSPYQSKQVPRVIIDYLVGERAMVIVIDCDTVESRDKMVVELYQRLAE